MTDGEVNWTEVPFCSPAKPDDYLLHEGDILVARTGSAGASMLVKGFPPSVFASYLIRLRVRRLVSADYLYWFLQTHSYWEQIRGKVRGTAHSNVNGKRLQTIRVPVASRAEQDQIVAELVNWRDMIRQLAGLQRTSAELARALEPAALAAAFR
jgi:type I restriction enzyme S subunit